MVATKYRLHVEKRSIRRLFYIGSLTSLVLLAGVLTYVYTQSLTSEYDTKIEQLRTSLLAEKKRFLRNAVELAIDFIEYERKHAREFFGDSLSETELELKTKESVGNVIRQLRLIDGGYVWVNQIVNWDGGDNYAIRAIHPNLPQTEGCWLSTNAEDIRGNRPYEQELCGIKDNGELFFDYYFKKLDSEKIEHKLSFAKLYKPYNWVVATGVYIDDLDQMIENEIGRMRQSYNSQLKSTVMISSVMILLAVLLIFKFERYIAQLITDYEFKIDKYTGRLEELSATDKLTGLFNRLKLDEVFEYEVDQSERDGNALSILLLDLDKFKLVNDTHGHQVGDVVLMESADILRKILRKTDTVGRWGGEEFLVILPDTDREQAMNLGNTIRKAFAKHSFPGAGHITCSIGVSTYVAGDTVETMLNRSDEALYCAKDNGRNSVVCESSVLDDVIPPESSPVKS